MSPHAPPPAPGETPTALDHEAKANLRYIRRTMERTASFTAISGVALVAIGVTAGGAALIAARTTTPAGWLRVWLGEAALALALGLLGTHLRARRQGMATFSKPTRRFFSAFSPPAMAAALFTVTLHRAGLHVALPALWLLLYGAGLVAGADASIAVFRFLGIGFMLCGLVAALSPPAWADPMMAVGFAGLHIVFGLLIMKRHGG